MAEDGPGSPLKRRVPGATGAEPVPSARMVLPDALIARMQAAVDAAHKAEGTARAAAAAEPVTEPLPTLRAAVAAQDWPTVESPNGAGERGDAWNFRLGAGPRRRGSGGLTLADEDDALDDLAESYLAADPDLTAGFADDAGLDDAGPDDKASHRFRSRRAVTTSGWKALGHDGEPGSDVKHERAAWWDHAVQSGRTRPPRPDRPVKPDRPAKPDRPVKEQRSDGPAQPDRPDLKAATSPPRPATGERGRRRARAMVGAVAFAVVLVVGGVVAVEVISHNNARNTKLQQAAVRKEARIRAEAARLAAVVSDAAAWVVAQVDHTAKVACDPVMCQALTNHGLPEQALYELKGSAASPLSASILVDTPSLRREVGASTVANWAPVVLTGFGVGADRVMVRVPAPHGAPAYEAALRADWKQRQLVGANLLTSSQITTTTSARKALAAGDVDDRLLLVITALASQHPIDIVAFSRTWAGASAGIPMRCAYLAETDPAAYMTEPVYVQAMIGLLRAQPPAYRPVHASLVELDGRKVLSIWYPAPSPLGLISPSQ